MVKYVRNCRFFLTVLSIIIEVSVLNRRVNMNLPLRGALNREYAKQWEYSMVSGNGKQGVMVFGGPRYETIIGNHYQLFLPKKSEYFIPDMAPFLDEVRSLIRNQGYELAQKFYYEKAKELGYEGLQMSAPFHPGFHLHIEMDVTAFQDYIRYTNFENGEIGVSFTDQNHVRHVRKTFVSRPDQLIVHQIKNEQGSVSCILEVEEYDEPFLKTTHLVKSDNIKLNHVYVKGEDGYDVEIKIVAPNGQVTTCGQRVYIQGASEVLLLMDIQTSKELEESIVASRDFSTLPLNYETLLNRHQPHHQELFKRVQLSLATDEMRLRFVEDLLDEAYETQQLSLALMEKLYDAGRYMFICSAGESIPNLQGIWSGTFSPAWSSDYTFDTNVQLGMASALYCQLTEGLQGLFKLVKGFMPEFQENARKYYGCRGIMGAIHSSNSGKHFHWNVDWPLQFWTCGAGWLGHWFYDYYLHTGDKVFLRDEVIPYLTECALFYEDFLVEEEGVYRFSPSYSAENGCGDNATQDIAVAKEVLSNLIKAYEELDIASTDVDKWKLMLKKLPPYLINEEGALKEWAIPNKDENYNHRHFSHLYPIFQSREFTKESEPVLWRGAEVALEKRLAAWMRNQEGDTSSSHGRMHAGLCATRLNQRDVAYESIEMMVLQRSMYPTLMTSHYNDHDIFNVDGNGAIPQIINEMLVYGDVGQISLLGAIPEILEVGSISGISLPKQVTVQLLAWNLKDRFIKLKLDSGIAQEISLMAPLYPTLRVQDFEGCEVWQVEEQLRVKLQEQKIAYLRMAF